ncbi:MAG: hypothetical protein KGJ23_08665 [Euryarchaeota archaeon]|nr:hypothetical protein [Euryarchaeota archaeon]MDE1836675.1 hypothetical protein [Euryarchaeota archaeon]MDE1880296.1 hypothetical protein [Euryarchaeota archaeon]MDE2044645.1 hypothetical protein [Thermoplasmata archaeon]
MAGSPPASPPTYTPSPLVKYFALVVFLIGDVVLSYVLKAFPNILGMSVAGSTFVAIFAFVAHDLETAKTPNGLPTYLTFIVITVAAAAFGALAYFDHSTFLEVSALVTWLIVLLGAVFHALKEDAGVNVPANEEVWAVSFLGIAVSLLMWYQSNSQAGVAGLIATAVYVVPLYLHVGSDGSVTPVPNPPDPSTPNVLTVTDAGVEVKGTLKVTGPAAKSP